MSQLSKLSRGVIAALRILPSMFVNEKRVSSTYPLKIVPSLFIPNGTTNPHPPLLPSCSSFSSATTYNNKEHGTSNSKDAQVKNLHSKKVFKERVKILRVLFDYDDPQNHLVDGLKVLSRILKLWKKLRPEDEEATRKAEHKILRLLLDYDNPKFADLVLFGALELWKTIICDLEEDCIEEWTINKDKYDDEDKNPIPSSVTYVIGACKVLMENYDDPDDMLEAVNALEEVELEKERKSNEQDLLEE